MTRALVLQHGFTQTSATWAPVVAALGRRDAPVLTPDLRGHGARAVARPIDFDACIEDLGALAPPCCALAGYSMGGRIALLTALAAPERFTSLTLIGATAGIADPGERAARRTADAALAAELEGGLAMEAFADRWGAAPLFAGQPPAVAAAARADRLRNTPAGLAAALRGIGTGAMTPVWERLNTLDLRVTLVAGERDAKFAALAGRMAERLPGARVVLVPGAGHAVHLEAPAAVAGLLAETAG